MLSKDVYYRQATGSKELEFVKKKTHGVSVYPVVFKTADLTKGLRDGMGKDRL